MNKHDGVGAQRPSPADERPDLEGPGGRSVPQDPILVVGAGAGIRAFVARALAAVSHPALTATDDGAALVLAQQVRPCLILLDAWAPRMGDSPFLNCYHRLSPPHPPVIIFAGDSHTAARAVYASVGACVRKRCSLEEVLAVIKRTAAAGTTLPPSVALEPSGRIAVLAWEDASTPCWLVAGVR